MESKTQNIYLLIKACKDGNKAGQRKLYELHYSYGIGICRRYAANTQEAQEMLNDGFYKVFTKIDLYDPNQPFKKWLRAVLVNSAIDYHRKYHKHEPFAELGPNTPEEFVGNEALENLYYEDVLDCVQHLPPRYRLVFNLFAIEDLSHQEIAEKLDISEGTSKSNFFKAKRKLQEIMQQNGYLKLQSHG